MIDIGFYQLAQRRAEAVLPPLVTKALAAGHRILVRTPDPALLAKLDTALWTQAPDSFIPHGIDTEVGPDRAPTQPVLLTTTATPAANAADCLAQIGDDLPDDLTGLARILFLFDADGLETARARWRIVSRLETARPAYWRESEDGRFEKAG
ncbi:DNA polymerase III subunit chi [Polymorphobacter glacialis]|uniref:DNA polymerase III subunit chi n=1 Tax=Sandarakinorhabdus glacialis TaxID=1614636 RepID=A0A916ZNU5_9SPHN|nr:DNA polymerase III subunit chi [Polymorphobacter glacialis]GGE06652.1 DNA polymerase III subunit chi [Polymorphobacter glacialis]